MGKEPLKNSQGGGDNVTPLFYMIISDIFQRARPPEKRTYERNIMSEKNKWLQFFADGASGGDGGDGAASGATSADAGQSTGVNAADAGRNLEDLGVPKDKAEQFRARKAKKQANMPTEPVKTEVSEAKPETSEWDTFMSRPENKQRLQSMMAERGKAATEATAAANEQMEKYTPMLKLLAGHYGIQSENDNINVDAVIRAVLDDDQYYEDRALENGETIDEAKHGWQKDYQEEQRSKQERSLQLQQHFYGMQQQANKLREVFPDFDLEKELQDPVFLDRTLPEKKMSVEDAYWSIHHGEIMEKQAEAIAKRAKADAAAAIRSGARPRENGGSAMATVSSTPNLKTMTREQRAAYIKAKYPAPG